MPRQYQPYVPTDVVYSIGGFEIPEIIPAEWYVAIVWNFGKTTLLVCKDYNEAMDKLQNNISLRPDLMEKIELRSGDTSYLMWKPDWTEVETMLVWRSALEAA